MFKNKKTITNYFTNIIFVFSIFLSLQVTLSKSLCQSPICQNQQKLSTIKSSTLHHSLQNLLNSHQFYFNKFNTITTYGLQFLRFTFTMSEQELKSLVLDLGQLYHINPNSLFYLPLYLIKACELLEYQNIPYDIIHSMVEQKLKFIMKITCVQQFQREKLNKLDQNNTIPLEWNKIQNAVETCSFERISLTSEHKSKEIEDIIIQMVRKAQGNEGLFEDLILNSCKTAQRNKINYKIKQKNQILQMKRIKQKLLKKYLESEYKICFNSFFMMQKHMQQIQHFQKTVDKILLNKTQIEFVVKDILRAKCQFTKSQQIFETALAIVFQIQELKKKGKQIKLVEFQNRLHTPICDILLVIEIENLGYEIQLAMDTEKARHMINHKAYEFSRSLVFSPISMLFFEFDIMTQKIEEKLKMKKEFLKQSIQKSKKLFPFINLKDTMVQQSSRKRNDNLLKVAKDKAYQLSFALINSFKRSSYFLLLFK